MRISHPQRGAATLAVVLLLLLLGALAVLSSAKVVYFGQKAANNAYHYGQAFSAAQAGLERGLSYLSYTGESSPNRNALFDSAARRLVAASFPLVEQLPDSRAAYSITMTQPDPSTDPFLVRITSTGCADDCSVCVDNCAPRAIVTQLVKFRKLVVGKPDDGLIAREAVSISGNVTVSNTSGRGAAVRSGRGVSIGGAAGAQGGVVQNDSVLNATSADAFFSYFFGDTKEAIKSQLPVLRDMPADGTTGGAYWLEGDIAVHGGTYGSPSEPVVLIVNGNFRMNGNTTIYGFVYVIGGPDGWDNRGGGTSAIIGGAASERSFQSVGTPDITADRTVMGALPGAVFPAKVPGSWRDF